jgi:hypothetical protein
MFMIMFLSTVTMFVVLMNVLFIGMMMFVATAAISVMMVSMLLMIIMVMLMTTTMECPTPWLWGLIA